MIFYTLGQNGQPEMREGSPDILPEGVTVITEEEYNALIAAQEVVNG